MNSTLLYLIQSSISLIIFYGFYILLFKWEAYFKFNRFYLLAAIIISLFLPTITFSIPELFFKESSNVLIAAPVYSLVEYTLSEVTIYGESGLSSNISWHSHFSFFDITILIYFIGVAVTLLHFIFQFYQLSKLFKQSKGTKHKGLRIMFTLPGTPVFSFFNYIFINKKSHYSDKEMIKIIEHEKIHAKQKHSIDIIIVEIIAIIQWFNPIVYFLKKSLKENHEFIADNNVIASYPDIIAYSKLLIENSSIIKTNLLTHNFSYSLLKRRLFMIKKTKNPLSFSLKLVVALMALNLVFFACSGPVQKDNSLVDEAIFYKNSAAAIHQDSILLQTQTYPDEGYVVFLVSLGKERDTKLELFDDNNQLIKSFFGGNWGPGTFGATWRPDEGKAIPPGHYSYVLIADDKKITGFFSYNTADEVNNSDKGVFTVVEQMPEFDGGMKALMTYLSENINYPVSAKEKGIEGRVFINFIVETDGSIGDIKVLRGIGGGCDEEAVRVISEMPRWKPGKQRGEAVRVSYNIPIKFTFNESINDTIYPVVDVMPVFPGGSKKLMTYLGNSINYPEAAKKTGVHGRVFVSFVIEADGSVTEAKILRGIGSGCDEEALRVVNSMPKWSPGLLKGKPVRVQYNLPIKYALN